MKTSDTGRGPSDVLGLPVTARGLTRRYPSAEGLVNALEGVDATFAPGRIHAVAGPSGAGKSTLLRLLALLEPPDAGTVTIGDVDATALPARQRRELRSRALTHLFQRPTDNLIDHLDGAGNVVLAAQLRGITVSDPVALLARFGLADRARAHPAQLSGGEQQRLAVAATFAARPAVLTVDEPTAELDQASAGPVLEGLRLLADAGCTIIVSSHDPQIVDAADDVLRLAPPAAATPMGRP